MSKKLNQDEILRFSKLEYELFKLANYINNRFSSRRIPKEMLTEKHMNNLEECHNAFKILSCQTSSLLSDVFFYVKEREENNTPILSEEYDY